MNDLITCPLRSRPEEIRLSQFVVMSADPKDFENIKATLREIRQHLRDLCAVGLLRAEEYHDQVNNDLVFKLKWIKP
jgi:hypothetical protein